MDDYNPNFKWGQQKVEITLMQWAYKAVFVESVGGNCLGANIFDTATENLYERLLNEGMGAPPASVNLLNPAGKVLECQDDDDEEEEWLKKMVVSVRIIECVPPTLNHLRKLNGADPVEGGDKPYVFP